MLMFDIGDAFPFHKTKPLLYFIYTEILNRFLFLLDFVAATVGSFVIMTVPLPSLYAYSASTSLCNYYNYSIPFLQGKYTADCNHLSLL